MPDQREPTSDIELERTFARRLREMREVRGLSQAALASECRKLGMGIDDLAILRMEKNAVSNSVRRIRLGEAIVIAKALDADLQWMVRPEPGPLNEQLEQVRQELDEANRLAEAAAVRAARATEERMVAMAHANQLRERLDRLIVKEQSRRQLVQAQQEADTLQREIMRAEHFLEVAREKGDPSGREIEMQLHELLDRRSRLIFQIEHELKAGEDGEH